MAVRGRVLFGAMLVALVVGGGGRAGAGGHIDCERGSGPHLAGQRVDEEDVAAAGGSLACADLTGSDLSDVDLTQVDLSGVRAGGADFSDARLLQADLEGGDFHDAVFEHADMSQVRARGADFRGADLSQTDLTQATLTDADLSGADLTGATLIQADLDGATTDGVRGVPDFATYLWWGALGFTALLLLGSIRRAFKPVVTYAPPGAFGVGMGYPMPMQPPPTWGGYQQAVPPPMPMTGMSPGAPQPVRRVASRLVGGIIGSVLVGLATHMFLGALLGLIGEQLTPLAAQCSGVQCGIGIDMGVTGVTIAPFLLIAGLIARSRG